jgi:hypothetical protein
MATPQVVRQTERYHADPVFAEKKRLRSLLRYHLAKRGKSDHGGTVWRLPELLGISIKELRAHIAAQFAEGMTWDNYGTIWEVDHETRLATAKTVDEVRKLFHYTNLRPLTREANRARELKCNKV